MDFNTLLNAQRVVVRFLDVNVDKNTVKDFRERYGLTQIAFANIMGVTKKAVEKWEQGKNKIGGSSAVLLTLLKEEPKLLDKLYYVEKVEKPYEAFKEVIKVTSESEKGRIITPPPHIEKYESCTTLFRTKNLKEECYC